MSSPERQYARLVKELCKSPEVVKPTGKKGFGSSGLYVRGKLFAFLSHKNELIVKLPRERVDELATLKQGAHWDPHRNGRVLKEWFVLKPSSKLKWLPLAREAMKFVGSSKKAKK